MYSPRITKNTTGKSLYDTSLVLCDGSTFTVLRRASEQSGKLCAPKSGEKVLMYFFEVKDGAGLYLAVILSDYDYSIITKNSDKQGAQDVIDNINLSNYNNKVKTILKSIVAQR